MGEWCQIGEWNKKFNFCYYLHFNFLSNHANTFSKFILFSAYANKIAARLHLIVMCLGWIKWKKNVTQFQLEEEEILEGKFFWLLFKHPNIIQIVFYLSHFYRMLGGLISSHYYSCCFQLWWFFINEIWYSRTRCFGKPFLIFVSIKSSIQSTNVLLY